MQRKRNRFFQSATLLPYLFILILWSLVFSLTHKSNVIFLQIRGSQIIDAVRLHKVGFPKHMALGEFRRRFGLLSTDFNPRPGSPIADERRAVEEMLLTIDVDPATYRVGQSQVSRILFFYFLFFEIQFLSKRTCNFVSLLYGKVRTVCWYLINF